MPYVIITVAIIIIIALTNKSGREAIAIMINLALIGGLILLVMWAFNADNVLKIINGKFLTTVGYTITIMIGGAAVSGYFKQIIEPRKKHVKIENDKNYQEENKIYYKSYTYNFPEGQNIFEKENLTQLPKKKSGIANPFGFLFRKKTIHSKNLKDKIGNPDPEVALPEKIEVKTGDDISLEPYIDSIVSRLESNLEAKNNAEDQAGGEETHGNRPRNSKGDWDEIRFHNDGKSGYISIGTKEEKKFIPRLLATLKYVRNNIESFEAMAKYLIWGLLAITIFMVIS